VSVRNGRIKSPCSRCRGEQTESSNDPRADKTIAPVKPMTMLRACSSAPRSKHRASAGDGAGAFLENRDEGYRYSLNLFHI
jgi:hypothetical protein